MAFTQRIIVLGIARASNGKAEFAIAGESLKEKVMRHLKRYNLQNLLNPRAQQPALTGVRIDWGGLKVQQCPSVLPPLFSEEPYFIYGLFSEQDKKGNRYYK